MSDLGTTFVAAAVAFGTDRLRRLAQRSAAELLQVIAPGGDPARISAALAELRRRADVAAGHPGTPELADAIAAAREVCRAAGQEAALGRLVSSATTQAGGIADQLDLAPAGDWTAQGTVLSWRLSGPRSALGPITLTGIELAVRFDWVAASLVLVLSADADVGIVGDALLGVLAPGVSVTTHVTISADSAGAFTVLNTPGALNGSAPVLRDFALSAGDLGLRFDARLTGDLAKGVVLAVDAGLRIGVDPAAPRPLGVPVPVPPTGAALSVNAGPVRGVGRLDQRDGVYTGTLGLAIGPITAEATVLLRPDPFELVLLFFSEFRAAIQLGFGFTLNGVGGLLAVNRGLSTDALVAGLHEGTADALLFPADRGTVDQGLLQRVFPSRHGAVAVGPAVKLGWGNPVSLLTAKVGVIVVLPDPKLVLLGAVRVAVPSPDLAIVDLNAEVYGEVTPDHLLVLVSLAGSRIAGFTLSGDFGLLVAYGGRPGFALSAGGFHPHYAPPAELSGLRRLAVDLSPPALLSLRAEAYLAITTNAFMLGARVEAAIDFGVASAHGHLAFDALVQWDPLHFELDIGASIEVEVEGLTVLGVALALHLEGPGRWVAHGTATIDVFFLPDIDLEIGPLTWGDQRVEPAVTVSPAGIVADQLADAAAWLARPPSGDQLATFRDDDPMPGTVLAHPLGGLEVRQRSVPIDTDLDRLGGYLVSEHRVTLGLPTLGGTAVAGATPTTDLFSPGQFRRLTDDARLSQPAFAPFVSGWSLSAPGPSHEGARDADYRWETCYPGQALDSSGAETFTFASAVVPGALRSSPVGRSRGTPYAVAGEPLRDWSVT